MTCPEAHPLLDAFADGELSGELETRVSAHCLTCAEARQYLDSVAELRAQTRALPPDAALPRDLWPGIQRRIQIRSTKRALGTRRMRLIIWTRSRRSDRDRRDPQRRAALQIPRALVPALLAACCLAAVVLLRAPDIPNRDGWTITRIEGTPRVGRSLLRDSGRVPVGGWVQTDGASRARMDVGRIGEVEIEPNTRLRLLRSTDHDHRLGLERGTLHARIWSPPRLFFVETPAATAVDLGCAYTLTVAENRVGVLRVTAGYVALVAEGRETLVPAGMTCRMRTNSGPGIPIRDAAPVSFRDAVERYERSSDPSALTAVLACAGTDDALSLWYLLERTEGVARGEVFDALARIVPPPDSTTRAGIVDGDTAMLAAWARTLGLDRFPAPLR